ncbi:MAG: hypothetical protein IJO53_04340 [Clostridia bacterium]|nr:hypothetical protein [Clostridia bacterium]
MKKHTLTKILCALLPFTMCLTPIPASAHEYTWHMGFGKCDIVPNSESKEPLYIAGYNQALEISGVLDLCQARAVWLDNGGEGILLIGVDCVALDSGTVDEIRASLHDLENVSYINVYSTHTHAGPDTLGLWGRIGQNGKNKDYMSSLVSAAEKAAREAAANRTEGDLYFGKVQTKNMYRDSRTPDICDENIYHLRFAPINGESGIRMLFYAAHAESLRGDNSLLSRDFPGRLVDGVYEQTGDNAIFMPGAIGGLIMTKAFVSDTSKDAVKNLEITSEKLIQYALSITPDMETPLSPILHFHSESFTVPLDNPVFLTYKFLGILNNRSEKGEGQTGYNVKTELCLLQLDNILIALLPGEIFPELVLGGMYARTVKDAVNPEPLKDIASRYGYDNLLIIGLANDELGYIVPPSDFLLNEKLPYIERRTDNRGEDHYEETNSVGPECAVKIAEAFESALKNLK